MIEDKTLDSSQEEASSSTSMRTRVVASAGSGLKNVGRWEWIITHSTNHNAINKKLYSSKYHNKK